MRAKEGEERVDEGDRFPNETLEGEPESKDAFGSDRFEPAGEER